MIHTCTQWSTVQQEEERNPASCNKMNGCWEHFTKWKKSKRRKILHDLMYMSNKNFEKKKRNQICCQRQGVKGGGIGWRRSKGTYFMEFPLWSVVMNLTSIHEDMGLIPGPNHWIKDLMLQIQLQTRLGSCIAVAVA